MGSIKETLQAKYSSGVEVCISPRLECKTTLFAPLKGEKGYTLDPK